MEISTRMRRSVQNVRRFATSSTGYLKANLSGMRSTWEWSMNWYGERAVNFKVSLCFSCSWRDYWKFWGLSSTREKGLLDQSFFVLAGCFCSLSDSFPRPNCLSHAFGCVAAASWAFSIMRHHRSSFTLFEENNIQEKISRNFGWRTFPDVRWPQNLVMNYLYMKNDVSPESYSLIITRGPLVSRIESWPNNFAILPTCAATSFPFSVRE